MSLRTIPLLALLAACTTTSKPDDDTGDDTGADTDVGDTGTDTADTGTAVAACDRDDACDGCEPEGTDGFTCDCRVTVADDPGTCRPIRVVILDDDEAGEVERGGLYLQPILEDAEWTSGTPMFAVTNVGPRWLWGGLVAAHEFDTGTDDTAAPVGDALSTSNTDVVFLLEGSDYSSELATDGETALTAFVEDGGGLVRTEWGTSYEELYPQWSPVAPYEDYIEDDEPKTWAATSTSDAVSQIVRDGLPTTFTMRHSIEDTVALTAAQTGDVDTITPLQIGYDDGDTSKDVPGIVVWPASSAGTTAHGTIVWVNSDLAYLADPPDFVPMSETEASTLFPNVARAASSGL